jgi:NADPH:quinone reductase-like Zn-dependent oxidoreductase
MTQVEVTKKIVEEIKDSIKDNTLKRSLDAAFEQTAQSGKKVLLEDRTLSISSTDSEYLSDKLDQTSGDSGSDEEHEISSNKRQQFRPVHSQTISRVESQVNLTERHLVEPDDSNLQTAVVIKSYEEPFTIDDKYPKPDDLQEHELLVENKFIGLNPIDWKGKKYRFGVYSFPWIQGRESSGVVINKGSKVENFEVGDEVFIASTSYRDLRTSTFQQFTVFDSRLVWKLPKNLSLKEGAAIGVGLVTAGSVLEELKVNIFGSEKETALKEEDRKSLLVWGGSSGVGSYVIQLAKVAKFEKIIAVASDRHNDFLKSIGATDILDRFKPLEELEEELKEIVGEDGLQIGVDVVGKETTDNVIKFLNLNRKNKKAKTFVGVVSKPSKTLDSNLLENIDVKEVLIKKFHENIEHGEKLVEKTHELLSTGELKTQKNLKVYHGFAGISKGLEDLEKYGASNEKYIVEL